MVPSLAASSKPVLLPLSIRRQRSVVWSLWSAHCSLLFPLLQGPALRICCPGCHLSLEKEILFQLNTVVICLNQDPMTLPRSLCLVTGIFQASHEVHAPRRQFRVYVIGRCFCDLLSLKENKKFYPTGWTTFSLTEKTKFMSPPGVFGRTTESI